MTTLKGVIRSVVAASRRIERDEQRSLKQATAAYKRQMKLQEVENNAQQFQIYNEYITTIQSIHKDCSLPVNWNNLLNLPEPIKPSLSNKNEIIAQNKFDNYKPSFFDKFFNQSFKKRENFQREIIVAKKRDNDEFNSLINKYSIDLESWQETVNLSKQVLNKEPEAYHIALQEFAPFSEISEIGSRLSFSINSDYAVIDLFVRSTEVIPDYELKLTSTGKLSQKKLPKSRFNEIYQDYVCSSILRIAREMFALLPIKIVFINAIGDILNTKTGLQEEQSVVSVAIPTTTLSKINFIAIDPSDSMGNFVFNMKFNKTSGFQSVERINPENFEII